MIGNPNWFKRRKYTGWGLTPTTWQGWLYVIVSTGTIISVAALIKYQSIQLHYQITIILSMIALMVLDVLDIARQINKDERERMHEAFAERNVSWYMNFILACGIMYQSFTSILAGNLSIDPFIIAAILGGAVIKGVSNWYLLDK